MTKEKQTKFVWDSEVEKYSNEFEWGMTDISHGHSTDKITLRHAAGLDYNNILVNLHINPKIKKEVSPIPFYPYPRESYLTHSEMQRYLALDMMFGKGEEPKLTPQTKKKRAVYKKLKQLILREQEDYQAYLYQIANQKQKDYSVVHPEVEKYVKERMLLSAERVKKYPRHYTYLSKIGISVVPFTTELYPYKIENFEVTLGTKNSLIIPDEFPTKLRESNITNINTNQSSEGTHWKKCSIMCDKNAEKLAIKWKADIVISFGSLCTLADNQQPFPIAWEIPFAIKSLPDDNKIPRRVVFIDNRLPPKSLTPKEKNLMYYKKAFKQSVGSVYSGLTTMYNQVRTLNTSSQIVYAEQASLQDKSSIPTYAVNEGMGDHEFVENVQIQNVQVFPSDPNGTILQTSSGLVASDNIADQNVENETGLVEKDQVPTTSKEVKTSAHDAIKLPNSAGSSVDEFSDSDDDRLPQLDGAGDSPPKKRRRRVRKKPAVSKAQVEKNDDTDSIPAIESTDVPEVVENKEDESKVKPVAEEVENQTKPQVNDSEDSEEPTLLIDDKTSESQSEAEVSVFVKNNEEVTSPKSQMSPDHAAKWKTSFSTLTGEGPTKTKKESGLFQPYQRPLPVSKSEATKPKAHPRTTDEPYQLSLTTSSLSSISVQANNLLKQTPTRKTRNSTNAAQTVLFTTPDPGLMQTSTPIESSRRRSRRLKEKTVVHVKEETSFATTIVKSKSKLKNQQLEPQSAIFDESSQTVVDELTKSPILSHNNTKKQAETTKEPSTSLGNLGYPQRTRSSKDKLTLDMWISNTDTTAKTPEKNLSNNKKKNSGKRKNSAENRSQSKTKDKTPQTKASTSTETNIPPFTPSNDLLGQILGMPQTKTSSKGGATNAWVEAAKSMAKEDKKYQSNNPNISNSESITEDELNLTQPAGTCSVSYVLWMFGNKRVLIRYYFEGKAQTPVKATDYRPISLHTKLEYQQPLAYEKMTTSEVCHDWLTLLIKSNSWIAKARIDPITKTLITVDWQNKVEKLLNSPQGSCLTHTVNMKMLTVLFKSLTELQCGNYLCTHKANSQHVEIKVAVELTAKKVIYDLHEDYKSPGQSAFAPQIPWLPGDPSKPCHFHREKKFVPLMFTPKGYIEVNSDGGTASIQTTPSSHKRNKKSKKRKR